MGGRQGLPLDGVKVIEFCQIAAGPFCGMLLADFGADVVKVENREGGDGLRAWPPLTKGFSENFASLNRNKRSVALDLKNPDDNAVALKLCCGADVLIENNRPGVMTRLGLGYETLARLNPRLVYASISGYGQKGPRASEGGFDVTIQAMSGIMSVTGSKGEEPVKCGVPISDFSAGLYAAFSVAAALRQVAHGDGGRHIDISLLGSSLAIAALQTSEFFGTGVPPKRLGAAHPRNAPYEAFRARDDHFVMAAGNNNLWEKVCKITHLEHLFMDDRFATNSARASNQDILKQELEAVFMRETAAHWLGMFRSAGVPCAPINDYASALDDPQVKAMGWIQQIAMPGGGTTRTFGSPVVLDGQTISIERDPPSLGEHNDEVFTELKSAAE